MEQQANAMQCKGASFRPGWLEWRQYASVYAPLAKSRERSRGLFLGPPKMISIIFILASRAHVRWKLEACRGAGLRHGYRLLVAPRPLAGGLCNHHRR